MSGNFKSFRLALLLLFTFVAGSLSAQTIKGNVKDATGEAVIGATVREQGTQNGTVTDFDGNFTLKTTGKQVIQISYVGMKTQTINAAGKSTINVVLEDDNTTLNDVVVIGYGSVKKKDLTGSVATVNNEALQAVPVANAQEALTGKMAGVQVMSYFFFRTLVVIGSFLIFPYCRDRQKALLSCGFLLSRLRIVF